MSNCPRYRWSGTPRQVAEFLSRWYAYKLTANVLMAVWDAEAEQNAMLRQERPPAGFGYLKPNFFRFDVYSCAPFYVSTSRGNRA